MIGSTPERQKCKNNIAEILQTIYQEQPKYNIAKNNKNWKCYFFQKRARIRGPPRRNPFTPDVCGVRK